jgi:hypothetical protein
MAPPRASVQASQGRPMDAPAFLASLNLPPGDAHDLPASGPALPRWRAVPGRDPLGRGPGGVCGGGRGGRGTQPSRAPISASAARVAVGAARLLPHTPSDSQCCSHGRSLTELLEPCSAATCLGRLVRKSLWLSSLPSAAIPGSGCGTGPAGRGRAGGSTSSMAAGYIRASTRLNEQRWESPAGLAAP